MTDSDDKLRRLYGTLPRDEPPAALDAAVLAASRRAVAPSSLARRWGIPLSVAAAAVLAIGLAMQMQRQDDGAGRSGPASMSADRAAPQEKSAGEAYSPEAKREAQRVPAAPSYAPRHEAGPNLDAARALAGAAAPEARSLSRRNANGAAPPAAILAPATSGRFSAPQSSLDVMQATTRGPGVAKTLAFPSNAPSGDAVVPAPNPR